ncbi:putative RNA polymerase sigma factor [Mycobacteroides chelonae]|nr:putative RNA polymerase sigma factor [Mycobacteroides chelonae]
MLADLMPDEPEALGLLALLLLTEARRPALTDAAGALVLLADQDRTRWNRAMITEGHQLMRYTPTTVVALNRAVAVAEPAGAESGLAAIEPLRDDRECYYPLHAARADLLARLRREREAAEEYRKALEIADNEVFRRYLGDRLARLEPGT